MAVHATHHGGRRGGIRLLHTVLTAVLVGGGLVAAGQGAAAAASPFSLLASMTHDQSKRVVAPALPGTDILQSLAGTDTVAGYQGFIFGLRNTTPDTPVTDPAITVHSGWSTSDFPGLAGPAAACPEDTTRSGTTFPITWTDTAFPLDGQTVPPETCDSSEMNVYDLSRDAVPPSGIGNPPLSFQPGFDSFRALDTTTVAPGGTQHMTVGFTVPDASYSLMLLRFFVLNTPETATSITAPAGLPVCPADPGLSPCATVSTGYQVAGAMIRHPDPGTEYSVSVTFTNDGTAPVYMAPYADVSAPRTTESAAGVPGSSLHIPVAHLDGSVPGSGSVDYSVAADQTADWHLSTTEASVVEYGSATYWPPNVGGGHFVIGDQNAAVGSRVTFWGSKWATRNGLSGGPAPASFTGFARSPETATCGTRWSAGPGGSAGAPATVPELMPVIVTNSAGKAGPSISGTTTSLVIVRTDPGYTGEPGHAGTGTVVAVLPC